jgi:hypothetical protein
LTSPNLPRSGTAAAGLLVSVISSR